MVLFDCYPDGMSMVLLKTMLFVTTLAIMGLVKYKRNQAKQKNNKHVCIIVLGDIGRSPRMNYHALSFADLDYSVTFIGYKGNSIEMTWVVDFKFEKKNTKKLQTCLNYEFFMF
jgi:hypothetical protein